ncbi:unnamed protein product [Cunninghamella blakesleeana]
MFLEELAVKLRNNNNLYLNMKKTYYGLLMPIVYFNNNSLEPKQNIQQVSDYFMDPVLSSLVRQYTESQMFKLRRQRIRALNEVSLTKSKPQAKDVIPNRVLEEQDEHHFIDFQNDSDMNENEIYVSPLLPKKRKYHSTSKIPNILRDPMGTPLSTSFSNDIATDPNTSSYNSPIPINNPTTSVSYSVSDVQINDNIQNNSDCNNQSNIVINNNDENNNCINLNEAIEMAETQITPNDNDALSIITTETANMSTMQHPGIPGTSISRKFLTMAKELKQTHLRSLRSNALLDIIPRHRVDVNYSLNDKKMGSKANENNEDNNLKSSSSKETISKRKYKKKLNNNNINDNNNNDDDNNDNNNNDDNSNNINNNSNNSDNNDDNDINNDSNNGSKNNESTLVNSNRTEIPKAAENELVYTITICYPGQPEKRLQEFKMLGIQKLTDLRDILYCRMDFLMSGDRKNQRSDGEVLNQHKKKVSASYFFIDHTFYVDQRDPTEPDNSEHIRKALNEQNKTNQIYNKEPMGGITLNELPLKINEPYLFNHQKNCQHVLLIRDIRLIKSKDELIISKYPIATYSWRYTRYKCSMCMIYPAEFITFNDYLSGCSPCYFCKRCYYPFHFNEQGEKVTTFDVYDYHGS